MQRKSGSIRNKLMLSCALVAAAVLATPAAMAHDYYRGHDDSGKVLGALVVGAVIGGVIASASTHHDRYYDGGYYYPAQSYPPQDYYESYPAYSYNDGGYYSYPAYPSYGSVNVGVVYTGRGGHGYYGGSRGYDHRGYGGHGGYRGSDHHSDGQGHYYSRHGH